MDQREGVLLQEVAAEGAMHQKPKSSEVLHAKRWLIVSIHFQAMRSAPDQSGIDITTWQERSTGREGSALDESESILEDLIEVNEESEQRAEDESNAKQILVNEDKAKATEMRKRAMETMGETKARIGEGCKEKKGRRSAGQSFQWLQEVIKTKQLQADEEKKAREEERREREEDRKERREEKQRRERERSYLMEQIKNQQYTQQQQQQFSMMQQFMMQMLEQQQKQSDMILELLKRKKKFKI